MESNNINIKRSSTSKKFFLVILIAVCTAASCIIIGKRREGSSVQAGSNAAPTYNGVLFQGFEWFLPDNGIKEENGEDVDTLWEFYIKKASVYADMGFTAIWLPPAFKSNDLNVESGQGYEPYDLYDLGEFDQKGRVSTKYGTKEQYLKAVKTLKENGINVYADVIIGHKAGGDEKESVPSYEVDYSNRTKVISGLANHNVATKFNYSGRAGKYSDFKWDMNCFDAFSDENHIFLIENKNWDNVISSENGNSDYLMFLDVDFDNEEVANETINWGKWYLNETGIDGIRLDAVKHIDYNFMNKWIKEMKAEKLKQNKYQDLFVFGEYFSGNTKELEKYMEVTDYNMSLLDYKLFFNMYEACNNGSLYDLRTMFDDTLMKKDPIFAMTFVNNHDQQLGRKNIENTGNVKSIGPRFKQQAYVSILTRESGYPSVFYGDYYGTKFEDSMKTFLDNVLYVRRNSAYGEQTDYFFDKDCIGWVRSGDSSHKGSGLAALISDGGSTFECEMNVGKDHKGECWVDCTGNNPGVVNIDSKGVGKFKCLGSSCAVWVPDYACIDKDDSSDVTIFYKSEWKDAYIHYCTESEGWTTAPGVKMSDTNNDEYKAFSLDLKNDKYIKFCFNDGGSNWNNNNKCDYTLSQGTYYIIGTKIYEGVPEGVEYHIYDDIKTEAPSPTEEPVVTEEPAITLEPTANPEDNENLVKIYYYTSWNPGYIHYKLGDDSWTEAPGVQMTRYNSKYSYYELDLGDNDSLTFCFNNGNGSWDSKNGANYSIVKAGSYIIRNGAISEGIIE